MEGNILVINNGSTSTKVALFVSCQKVLEDNVTVDHKDDVKYDSVMDRREDCKEAILDYLRSKDIDIEDIDLVMARGGLVSPVTSGVYAVNEAMIRELYAGQNGVHACNLSAVIADDIAAYVNTLRKEDGKIETCAAYIADPPLANDLLPEYRLSGLPELTRRSVYHALNSRAVVRSYAASIGKTAEEVVVIVAHIGGGSSVSLHEHGKITDVNDSLGGDGPISVERAGTVPAFPIIDICFSGKYTKEEVQKMLVGNGGAMSYFGTKDIRHLVSLAQAGDKAVELFLKAYCASVAKYIGYFSTDVCGKLDAIIITGGVAYNSYITDEIARRVEFIAPVKVYPGEDEIQSLAENGYRVLSGDVEVNTFVPDAEESSYEDEDVYKDLNYVANQESEELTPGQQLKRMLLKQLERLPRIIPTSNGEKTGGRLWRTLAKGYRGEPLWKFFKRNNSDNGDSEK